MLMRWWCPWVRCVAACVGAILAVSCTEGTGGDQTTADAAAPASPAGGAGTMSSPASGGAGGTTAARGSGGATASPRMDAAGRSPEDAPDVRATGDGAAAGDGAVSPDAGSVAGNPAGDAARASRAVFLAQGHMGRTMISCDDGLTWIHNRSQDDNVRCFEGGLDCDHSPYAGRGLAFGNGWFVVTWGWGAPGSVQRSRDGVTWETVLTAAPNVADIAFGNGGFAANGDPTRLSTDGKSWQMGGRLAININYRSIDFIPHAGGRFLVTGESNTRAIVTSSDGTMWTKAVDRPDACGGSYRGAAYGAGTVVLASAKGHICYSRDGGERWQLVPLGTSLSSPVVWTGTEFLVWGGSSVYSSADGAAWAKETIQPAGVSIGAVARGSSGTLVASNDGWLAWYDKQRMFRSTDGRRWTILDRSSYAGSHPINFIEAAETENGVACADR